MNDLVFIKRGQAVCDSLQVAEKFGKRHAEVLYAIEGRPCSCGGNGCSKCNYRGYQQRGLLDELMSADKSIVATSQVLNQEDIPSTKSIVATSQVLKMYRKSSYIDSRGRRKTLYLMNRDGFTLLTMGFTGQEALSWKMKYIGAFNKLELALIQQQTPLWQDTRSYQKSIRRQETDIIKLFVQYAENQGSSHAERYYQLFSSLADKAAGIEQRDYADAGQLHQLAMIEKIIGDCIAQGIENQTPYKGIYTECKARIEQFQGLLGITARNGVKVA